MDVSDTFIFSSVSAGGDREEESETKFGIKKGGLPRRAGEVGRTGLGGCLRGGAGAKYLFSGPKVQPSILLLICP